jgi:hypothetical protein
VLLGLGYYELLNTDVTVFMCKLDPARSVGSVVFYSTLLDSTLLDSTRLDSTLLLQSNIRVIRVIRKRKRKKQQSITLQIRKRGLIV